MKKKLFSKFNNINIIICVILVFTIIFTFVYLVNTKYENLTNNKPTIEPIKINLEDIRKIIAANVKPAFDQNSCNKTTTDTNLIVIEQPNSELPSIYAQTPGCKSCKHDPASSSARTAQMKNFLYHIHNLY